LYRAVVRAGTHKATSIRVAEAAKVIENTQRDVNIALINELALLFSRLGIDTEEVLQAAGSKWNFLPFRPGLVGRSLHRCRPLLPDAQGAGNRLSSGNDPRRPAPQRQHG
jgi:UDP-N-acetyl-D-mannosaminuronate dehydrogenase